MSETSPYGAQYRGDRGAYDRYLQGMDASMRQKVALTAAHLLTQGHVADMGMGSGAGSHALAVLYPALRVTGVDISDTMVARAREVYADLANLSFQQGDIAAPCFPPETLDGIFNSSVLHHVTTFNGYDHQAARRALEIQAQALRPEGVMIVRDFLDPGPEPVWLDLPADDGLPDASDPTQASTAALFERFATEFRPLSSARGFPYQVLPATPEHPIAPGRRRYQLAHKHAVEFVLRKDWRADWATEVLEEYTYFTHSAFEQIFSDLGLRVVASTPIRNPWILRHRFAGQFDLRSATGAPLEPPATNYIIVGERAALGQGVALREGPARAPEGFLTLDAYRDLRSGRVRDVVRRPHLTVDIVPWFELDGDSPYMLLVADVLQRHRIAMTAEEQRLFGIDKLNVPRSAIPAVTHVDYSARVQTVERSVNPALHAVLTAFAERPGCPVLVNTSFNVRGEPPVCHPREAIAGFLATEMDCLALGPFFLEKRRLPADRLPTAPTRQFAPD